MKELIKIIIKRIIWFFKKYRYKSRIGRNCNISIECTLGGKNKISNNVNLGRCYIGFATYIGNNSVLGNTIIGKYCSVASNVRVISGEHPSKIFVSTHPAFFSLLKQSGFTYVNKQLFQEVKYKDEENKIEVVIGNDVWIGDGVKILSGIKIGDGAIVGAGTLVTKDLEPYSIYVGIPAKKIRDRFSEKEKEFLLDYKWWNKDEEWIKKNVDIFRDITMFMKIVSNENENKGEKV